MIDPKWHGTTNGYGNLKCRCVRCREAHRASFTEGRQRRYAQRQVVNGRLVHPSATHGTPASYTNYGCRCEPCKTANNTARAAWRQSRRATPVVPAYREDDQ